MKKLFLLLILLFQFDFTFSQTEKYHKVEITGGKYLSIELLKAGITIDHSELKEENIITEISESEIEILKRNNFNYKILINDMASYYEQRILSDYNSKVMAGACNAPNIAKPTHFHLGSMGGYFTYTEMQNILDTMALLFPSLITNKQALSPQSIEGRNIWFVKISDNPGVDESEPELLYDALHHAREGASLSQLIFYMWYLLENYSTNPDIQFLVDNTEMFFMPCVNPDGYVYNQTTNPNGGGMWRKNRRNNGTTFGVDLNRNYGYNWGYDNVGSSPTSSSDTYRGTAGFSEPETQAIRNFCNARQFKTALNAHTYGNLLIYPWGYLPSFYTPDSATYVNWATYMSETSRFLYGTGDQTVNYVTNGDSDDWMYGEQISKPKMLAMTPEAGAATDGFWPASSRIIDICKTTFNQNLNLAKLVTNFALVKDAQDNFIFNNGYIKYDLQRLGLQNGNFTVSIIPSGTGISTTGSSKIYSGLTLNQKISDSISFTLSGGLTPAQQIKYLIAVNNGVYTHYDTITKIYGNAVTVLNDPCNNTSNWNAGGWGVSSTNFKSGPGSITDSPIGNYANSSNKSITLLSNLNLTNAIYAHLQYYTKFMLEKNYDKVMIYGSTNGGSTWAPLCGKYETSPASFGGTNPMYDGLQDLFVKEEIDLNSYLGQNLLLRFTLTSDNASTEDGFYFDELLVRKLTSTSSNINQLQLTEEMTIYPNPGSGIFYVTNSGSKQYAMTIKDATGRVVMDSQMIEAFKEPFALDLNTLAAGIYFTELTSGAERTVKKLIIQR